MEYNSICEVSGNELEINEDKTTLTVIGAFAADDRDVSLGALSEVLNQAGFVLVQGERVVGCKSNDKLKESADRIEKKFEELVLTVETVIGTEPDNGTRRFLKEALQKVGE